ncbi:S8 family serine peptidase [Paenibacillus alvei]|uniref:S8 family serine peptidase n=1 Tax=Paenibacillus alvei TaxID=44250 RepID=A0ABT4GRL5_PAEAL|nr:S8 family serine peptidase [Paenibacillus alvei]MCY9759319.1 S8 family serine peptidase [Paenibacillus alvei]MCY9766614.1 S8 family serine peptidase [Paenibacillus alvei]
MKINSWYNPIMKALCTLFVAAALLAAPLGTKTAAAQIESVSVQADSSISSIKQPPYTGKGVKIAIIDSGADIQHPLLKERIVEAYDFVENDTNPQDEKGHGTHVAGIVAQQAPDASLLIYRAIATEGHEFTSTIVKAMQQAVKDGAKVINLSLHSDIDAPDEPLSRVIADAVSKGVVVVNSAGNAGDKLWSITAPGLVEDVITVGAATLPTFEPMLLYRNHSIRLISGMGSPDFPKEGSPDLVFIEGNSPNAIKQELHQGKLLVVQTTSSAASSYYEAACNAGASGILFYQNDKVEWEPELRIDSKNDDRLIPAASISPQGASMLKQGKSWAWQWGEEQRSRMSAISSRGPAVGTWLLKPDLVAPGINVRSSVPRNQMEQGYGNMSGTSMAAPYVSAAAAVLLEAHPEWTPAMVKSALMTSADKLTDNNGAEYPYHAQGSGLVNVDRAMETISFLQPAALSYGVVDPDSCDLMKEQSLQLTNRSNHKITYQITLSSEAGKWDISYPASVTVQPGETVRIPVAWNLSTLQETGVLTGYLQLIHDTEKLRVPIQLIRGASQYPLLTGWFASHQLLTPNGDKNKSIEFHYYLPGDAERMLITATRIDKHKKNRKEYLLLNTVKPSSGLHTYEWKGTDVSGHKLPDGLYNLKSKAFADSRSEIKGDQLIYIDREAPTAIFMKEKAEHGIVQGTIHDMMLELEYAVRPMLHSSVHNKQAALISVKWSTSNTGAWKEMRFNEDKRTFYISFIGSRMRKGTHDIFIRMEDAAGNAQIQKTQVKL